MTSLLSRNQCEELRSTLSKRQQDQVCVERLEQLRIKEEIEREKQANEIMYAELWEKDRLAKAAKEERDAISAHDRNREVLTILRKQAAALEQQKEASVQLKKEEAELLVSNVISHCYMLKNRLINMKSNKQLHISNVQQIKSEEK